MSGITSHVLDTSRGMPAAGIDVLLEWNTGESLRPEWEKVGSGTTNIDGRVSDLVDGESRAGHFRISFLVAAYFQSRHIESFYPVVRIEFNVDDADQHFHVPLLLNPFGYSTYRGS